MRKSFIIFFSSILFLLIFVHLLISPVAKYLIEKYDVKYTGRQITLDDISINIFTGNVHIRNLKIYEHKNLLSILKNDTVFISINEISANFSIRKLFSKTMEINSLTLNKPGIVIIQKNRKFNFDDLVTTFSSDTSNTSDTTNKPFHFYFRNVKIKAGHFYYIDKILPVNFSIKNVNIESKEGWCWDKEIISAKFAFLSENGRGGMKGRYAMNLQNLNYSINIVIHKFDMRVIEQYMKSFVNYGAFRANLDADLVTNGCYRNAQNINIKGLISVNDFHLGKNRYEDYLSFSKLAFRMNDVNPEKYKYYIDTISLIRPYLKYEKYDYLDNLQRMFGKRGGNISAIQSNPVKFNLIFTIAGYIKILAINFLQADYKINKMLIQNACLKFDDYSVSEKFSMEANPLNIVADSLYKNKKWLKLNFNSGIQPYGTASVSLGMNPKDSTDFDLNYHIQQVPLAMFNPYFISYTSFPFNKGTIDLTGLWNVRKGIIKSNNHILVIDPRVSKRLKNEDAKWVPVPFILSLIRERGNVIDYEIPITGNLKNPKFHLSDIFMDMIENIFMKPVSAPYRFRVKIIENKIEKLSTLKWEMRQSSFSHSQNKFIKKIAKFLIKNPKASIAVYPMIYAEKEKEQICFFEAKKKYFLLLNHKKNQSFTDDDSLLLDKMSVKNPLFIGYLNKHLRNPMLFTIQEKCTDFIGSALINARFYQLNNRRKISFLSRFKEKDLLNRVKVYNSKNNIPYNGFSFYKIVYKGEVPESLIKANRQIDELNNEAPRSGFKKIRDKIKALLTRKKQ